MTTESIPKTITIPLDLAEDILETLPMSWHIATTLRKHISDSKIKPHYTADEVIAIAGGFK